MGKTLSSLLGTPLGRVALEIGLSLALAFFLSLFFSFSLSPLYPLPGISSFTYDNEFFLLEASLLLEGRVPYVDFYDHKGTFHVYLTALGLLMGGRGGVFLLEVLAGAFSFFFLLRSAYLLFPRRSRASSFLLAASLSVLGRFLVLNGGGHEGEWILPWVSLSLFLLLFGTLRKKNWAVLLSMFLSGTAAGLSLMSRPLDAFAALSICFLRLLLVLKEKEPILHLAKDAALAFLGLLPPLSLFLGLAAGGGYLDAMLEALLGGNASYLSSIGTEIYPLDQFLLTFLGALVSSCFYLGIGALYRRRGAPLDGILSSFAFATSFYLLLLSPFMRYFNYLWGAFPLLFLPLMEFPFKREGRVERAWRIGLFSLGILVFSLSSLLNPALYWSGAGAYGLSIKKSEEYLHDMDLIPEEAYREGEVFVLNVDASLYLLKEDFLAPDCPCLHFQSWWSAFSPSVREAVEGYLLGPDRPRYIIMGEEEKTFRDFGEALGDYRPYRDEEIQNEEFLIYSLASE